MLKVFGNVVGFKGAVVDFGALCQSSPSRSSILDYWKGSLTIGQYEGMSVDDFGLEDWNTCACLSREAHVTSSAMMWPAEARRPTTCPPNTISRQ